MLSDELELIRRATRAAEALLGMTILVVTHEEQQIRAITVDAARKRAQPALDQAIDTLMDTGSLEHDDLETVYRATRSEAHVEAVRALLVAEMRRTSVQKGLDIVESWAGLPRDHTQWKAAFNQSRLSGMKPLRAALARFSWILKQLDMYKPDLSVSMPWERRSTEGFYDGNASLMVHQLATLKTQLAVKPFGNPHLSNLIAVYEGAMNAAAQARPPVISAEWRAAIRAAEKY